MDVVKNSTNAAATLSSKEQQRVAEFEATAHGIEEMLKKKLRLPKQPFAQLIKTYGKENKDWPDEQRLKNYAVVRNLNIHSRTKPNSAMVVPTADALSEIKSILKRLEGTVGERFGGHVEAVSVQQSLSDVLGLIRNKDYSQFPVYESTVYKGLITENGITRWLSRTYTDGVSFAELHRTLVADVLLMSDEEAAEQNAQFISAQLSPYEVALRFSRELLLEAVLITKDGSDSDALLGIVTRWDAIEVWKEMA